MFTKLNGDTVVSTLTPTAVRGPYSTSRRARTIVHELLQSNATRVTHLPTGSCRGSFVAVFADQATASAAVDWFTGPYLYSFTQAGATAATTLFAVTDGDLALQEHAVGVWDLTIPYREVIA